MFIFVGVQYSEDVTMVYEWGEQWTVLKFILVVRTTKINFNRQVMRVDLAQDYRAIWNLMTLYVHIDSHNQLTRY